MTFSPPCVRFDCEACHDVSIDSTSPFTALIYKNQFVFSLRYEELHSLLRSPNIVRAIKSRRLMWAGHVARMEKDSSAFKILTG